jgi:hypothetical protein
MRAKRPSVSAGEEEEPMSVIRRSQVVLAVLACTGTLMSAAGGSNVVSALAQNRRALVVHHDATARVATVASTTKFLLHAGIAYYVFDHYIWKPFKAGHLHGFTHAFTIAKALVAAVFVYHEVKLMIADAKNSKLLSFLATPITAVVAKLESLKSDITGGHLNAVNGVQSGLGSIKQQSNAKGAVIKEITHSL